MKIRILIIFFLLSWVITGYSEETGQRGFMFQFGIGGASINYTPELDAALNTLDNLPGVDRFTIYLDLGLGYAINSKTYLLFSISGVGDRIEDPYNYMQINTFLYAPGIRYYPWTTGLVLGADIGFARMAVDTDFGMEAVSEWGTGIRAVIAYDFARKLTGFSVVVGLAVTGASIESESVNSAQLYINLLWK
jgi:hypothetical protein